MTTNTARNKYQFDITSDLHKFGVTEDGEDYVGEVYFVTATDSDGHRFIHHQSFPGCQKTDYPEDDEDLDFPYYFADIREEAQKAAEALVTELITNDILELNPVDWHKTSAVYGASAYNEQDTIDWEREHDRMS